MIATPCEYDEEYGCDCGATGCPEVCTTLKPADIYDGWSTDAEKVQAETPKKLNRHERRAAAKKEKNDE